MAGAAEPRGRRLWPANRAMKPSVPRQTVRFGPFEVSLHDREIRRQGVRVPLQAQPFAVLEWLVAHPGELVTREELRQRLWPDGTFVDFDKSLNTAVMKLREALGDNAQAPLFIETAAKIGYRFIASVTEPAGEAIAPPLSSQAAPPPIEPARALPGRRRALASLGVAAVVALSAAVVVLRAPRATSMPARDRPMRFEVRAPPGWWLTGEHALAPDGRTLVMVATDASSERRLWSRAIDSVAVEPLPGTEGATLPFWAPDSASVGFFADRKLKRIDLAGEKLVRVLADAPDGRGGAWGAGDVIVFAPDISTPLYRVSASGGAAAPVTRLGEAPSHRWPSFLPGGTAFVFQVLREKREESELRLGSVAGDASTPLFRAASGAAYAPTGHLLFVAGRTLYARRFDATERRTTGEPVPLSDGVPAVGETGATGYGSFSAAAGGLLTFAQMADGIIQFAWFDRRGREIETVGPPDSFYNADLSRDGAQLALVRADPRTRTSDLWRIDMRRGVLSRMTGDSFPDAGAVWSPDAQRVAFASLRQSRWSVIVRSVALGTDEALFTFDMGGAVTDWSADGRVLVGTVVRGNQLDMWRLELGKDAKPVVFAPSPFNEASPGFSPDGRWIAFSSDRTGRREVYLVATGGTAPAQQVSSEGGEQPSWRGDGREIFFLSPSHSLMAVPVALGGTARLGVAKALFTHVKSETAWGAEFVAARDGSRFLIPRTIVPQGASAITVDMNRLAP